MQEIKIKRGRGERGNSIVEFALVSVFLVPVLIGTFVVGMSLNREMSISTLVRDLGAMIATEQLDFAQAGNQALVVRLAGGLGLDNSNNNNGYGGGDTGNGQVVLSYVLRVGTRECNTLPPASALLCNNEIGASGQNARYVFTRRIVIGNRNLQGSFFGAPSCAQNVDGTITAANYLTIPLSGNCAAANATTFASVLALNPSENTYVVEANFNAPELDGVSPLGFAVPSHFYVRNLF